MKKMKQLGWSVNWTDKRKHLTFQNLEGKKVRDSNLSKTFHLNISKEGMENEFDGNRKKARDTAERDNGRTDGKDKEFAGYYRQVEVACTGTGEVIGSSDSREEQSANTVQDMELFIQKLHEKLHIPESGKNRNSPARITSCKEKCRN